MKKESIIALGAVAGLAYLATRGGKGLLGLSADESEQMYEAEYQQAYSDWYYNQYVPWYRQKQAERSRQAYQPGWQYQQQGYGQQPSYGYGQPSYGQPTRYTQAGQDACMIQGGKLQDTGAGFVCSGSTSGNVSSSTTVPPNVI